MEGQAEIRFTDSREASVALAGAVYSGVEKGKRALRFSRDMLSMISTELVGINEEYIKKRFARRKGKL